MTSVRIHLPAGTMAVPAARRFASETLRSWHVAERAMETVELVVSELVGNAVEHGGGAAELRLSLLERSIRVDIVDTSPELPVLCSPEPVEDRHRGLLIVGALSTRWGTDLVGGGKSVWAELPATVAPATLPTQQPAGAEDRSMSG